MKLDKDYYYMEFVQSKDIKDYSIILEEFEEELGPYIAWTLLAWCGVLKDDRKEFWELFLVKKKGKTIGITGVYSLDKKAKNLWLGWFGIIKKERRGGVGSEVLDFSINLAQREGAERFYLYTGKDNKGAIKFYKKNGFKVVSTVGEFLKKNKHLSKDNFELMDDIVISKAI